MAARTLKELGLNVIMGKRSRVGFKDKIILGIPFDEEGMMLGIKHFIKQGWADDVDGAIICELENSPTCIAKKKDEQVSIDQLLEPPTFMPQVS